MLQWRSWILFEFIGFLLLLQVKPHSCTLWPTKMTHNISELNTPTHFRVVYNSHFSKIKPSLIFNVSVRKINCKLLSVLTSYLQNSDCENNSVLIYLWCICAIEREFDSSCFVKICFIMVDYLFIYFFGSTKCYIVPEMVFKKKKRLDYDVGMISPHFDTLF